MSTAQELPRLYSHCVDFYNLLKDNAESNQYGELVFEGYTVALAKESLGIAGPTYANVLKSLTAMGSIVQLQRGSKHATSKWSILDPPTLDAFRNLDHKANPTSRTLEKRLDTIEQDLSSLRLSIGGINVQEALIGLSRQIQELKDEYRLLKGGDQTD